MIERPIRTKQSQIADRQSKLPRHRRASYGVPSYVVLTHADEDHRSAIGEYLESSATRFFRLFEKQLQLLSSPLWKWAGQKEPVAARSVVEQFEIPDIRAEVKEAISRPTSFDSILLYANCRRQPEPVVPLNSFEYRADDLHYGLASDSESHRQYREHTGSSKWLWDTNYTEWDEGPLSPVFERDVACIAIPHHGSRYFTVGTSYGLHTSPCKPDGWIDGHDNLRRTQREASDVMSLEESSRSAHDQKERDSIGRSIGAEFHMRLVERRIEQTLTIHEAGHVH